MKKLVFPPGFLWGSATAAHQVEGNNTNSDWWMWEQSGGTQPSGRACGQYELYPQDLDLIKSLDQNCYRFSVEWARIQPDQHTFSDKEIAHYRSLVDGLRQRGIEPVVTLHHFTSPVWFDKLGSWYNPKAADLFVRYCEKVVEALGDKVKYWITINEPMVLFYYGYIRGWWPPFGTSIPKSRHAHANFIRAHVHAYRLIHSIYKKKGFGQPKVSIAHNMVCFEPCTDTIIDRCAAATRNKLYNMDILTSLCRRRTLDYIGLNYYTRNRIHAQKCSFNELMVEVCRNDCPRLPLNVMGWEIYPEGILKILRQLRRYRLPVFILENGICTDDDTQRWAYIRDHLEKVHQAIGEGSHVEGYCYWSLLDNFEWDKGFRPRFGIVEVDFATQRRTVRESARRYAQVCRTGVLEV
ncbi:MAG: glycoside hydrolase family 1 protein [Deltaproteobacteria bacterium]